MSKPIPDQNSIQRKNFRAYGVKSLDSEQGILEAIVSVFNNVDYGGDRVLPGFFTKSLERKYPKGVWMHDWTIPVAKTLDAKELAPGDLLLPEEIRHLGGLYIKSHFNLQTQRGKEAFSDIAFGIIDEFSIGFIVTDEHVDSRTGVRDLIEGELFEWSPVLVGMNPATSVIGVKEMQNKDAAPAAAPATKNEAATGEVRVKSQYLGYWAESAAASAAISELSYYLMWYPVYDALYETEVPAAERLESLTAAFDEYRDLCIKIIRAVIDDGDTAQIEAKSIRALWPEPSENGNAVESPAGLKFFQRMETALAAVTNATKGAQSIRELRVKDGRDIGANSLTRLQELHVAVVAAGAEMKTLLDASKPVQEQTAAKQRALRAQAAQNELDILSI